MEETVEVGACCDLRFLAEFFSLWFGLLFDFRL
jgi:hypothetical protein